MRATVQAWGRGGVGDGSGDGGGDEGRRDTWVMFVMTRVGRPTELTVAMGGEGWQWRCLVLASTE